MPLVANIAIRTVTRSQPNPTSILKKLVGSFIFRDDLPLGGGRARVALASCATRP